MALSLNTLGGIATDVGMKAQVTFTQLTLDASYAAGGVPLTARQLGMNKVVGGHVSINTATAAVVTSGDLVPQSDGSAKLKLNLAGAELGAGAGTGVIADVLAVGV